MARHVRRAVHPAAWWLWAIGLGAAATRTTNILVLSGLIVVALIVVWACQTPSPVDRAHWMFVKIAVAVLVIRLVLQMVFAPAIPGTVLFTLPSLTLPEWAAGTTIGGPVTLESLVAGLRHAMQLAALLVCVGSVTAVTTPWRMLQSLPAVLYEAGVAVTVALSVTPQAIVSVQRLRSARRLRGRPVNGPAAWRGTAVPVLEGSMARSLTLAASMDARGYGPI